MHSDYLISNFFCSSTKRTGSCKIHWICLRIFCLGKMYNSTIDSCCHFLQASITSLSSRLYSFNTVISVYGSTLPLSGMSYMTSNSLSQHFRSNLVMVKLNKVILPYKTHKRLVFDYQTAHWNAACWLCAQHKQILKWVLEIINKQEKKLCSVLWEAVETVQIKKGKHLSRTVVMSVYTVS